MTKADMRVKKSLTKIRHALCKILSSTPELTDYNFTVGIIATTAGVSQSTVRRRIQGLDRKSGTEMTGRRISPWTLFELFNTEVMEELEQRRAFQNKIGVEKSTGDFYAVLASIHHHHIYIGAMVRHYGRCAVIGDMLELASELLWQDYLKTKGSSASPITEVLFRLTANTAMSSCLGL